MRRIAALVITLTLFTAAAHAVDCERRLAHAFVRVVERAAKRGLLSVEEVRALSEAPRPYNPLGTRRPDTQSIPFIQFFQIGLADAEASWPMVQAELKHTLLELEHVHATVTDAREKTEEVLSFNPLPSIPTPDSNLKSSAVTHDGRILALTVSTSTSLYRLSDMKKPEPLWESMSHPKWKVAMGLDENREPLLYRYRSELGHLVIEKFDTANHVLGTQVVDVAGAPMIRELVPCANGQAVVALSGGRTFALTGGRSVEFEAARGLEFFRAIPGEDEFPMVVLTKLERVGSAFYFAHFDGRQWSFLTREPFYSADLNDATFGVLRLRDGRFAMASFLRDQAMKHPLTFQIGEEPALELIPNQRTVRQAGLFERHDGRLWVWSMSGTDGKSALEVFEPTNGTEALFRAEVERSMRKFEFFQRDGRTYLVASGPDGVEIFEPEISSHPLLSADPGETGIGPHLRVVPNGQVYFATWGSHLQLYELFSKPR